MGGFSIWHILIVAIILLLLFGGNRFSAMMGDVAKGLKSFKQGMADEDEDKRRDYDQPRRTDPPRLRPAAPQRPAAPAAARRPPVARSDRCHSAARRPGRSAAR